MSTEVIQENGFHFEFTRRGHWLTYSCIQCPDELVSKDFVVNHYITDIPQYDTKLEIASRSNPSLYTFDKIYVHGAYKELNARPYIFDLRKECGQDSDYERLVAFYDCLWFACTQFKPEKVIRGSRLEDKNGARIQPPEPSKWMNVGRVEHQRNLWPNLDWVKAAPQFTLATMGETLKRDFLYRTHHCEGMQNFGLWEWLGRKTFAKNQIEVVDINDLMVRSAEVVSKELPHKLDQAKQRGAKVIFVSQEWGMCAVPMKQEHRDAIRLGTELTALFSKAVDKTMWFINPYHVLENPRG